MAFFTLCRHFEFGCQKEKNYLCGELFNKSGSYAFFEEDIYCRHLFIFMRSDDGQHKR